MGTAIIFIIIWGLCGLLGYAVAKEQKKGLGAVLGVAFGPLGVLIAALV